jgi:dipeptidase E
VSASGTVGGLSLRPAADAPVALAQRVLARAGGGLEGDHAEGGKRGVTLLDAARWADAAGRAGAPDLPWHARRANVLVEGLDLLALIGRRVRLGPVLVHVHGETLPCKLMERAQQGLRAALEGGGGGVHGEILEGGWISVGDPVVPGEGTGMRLLLHSGGYFDRTGEFVRDFFGATSRLLFVPWAGQDRDAYTRRVAEVMRPWGFEVTGIHEGDPRAMLERAEGVFVGGGNTFRLLSTVYAEGLLEPLRERVRAGLPYLGSSAGSNLACPTIMTTNDMPICRPPSFDALGLVPFQINPHYLDPDPASTHQGETREKRLLEYHEMNDRPVVGLREGTLLRREGAALTLLGSPRARLFLPGRVPSEHEPGSRLDFLLEGAVPA